MQPVIEDLSLEQKRSLLASLLNRNHQLLQLSTTQERLWQLCQVQPDTAVYNFQTSVQLHGQLLPEALEIAALSVVLRHDVLRTCYGTNKGKPSLVLVPLEKIDIARHDVSNFSHEEQEQKLEVLGMEDAQRSFDMNQPPLFRLTLVRLAPDRHRLYLTMHHIVSDFLSLDLFLFELGVSYSTAIKGGPDKLPSLHVRYQDFATAQRRAGTDGPGNEHLEYWRRTLADAQPMEWFSDHVRPTKGTGRAETEFFYLPTSLMQQVEAFARKQQVTPFMVLLTAFNVVLHACSGKEDLIVGSPMAGRVRSEYESLIGMFSYPVLMRANLAACHDFYTLLQRVRKMVLEATEHGEVPFARVADSCRHSGLQRGSLLRAMFSYVGRLRKLDFEGIVCRRRPTNRGITDLDLFLTLYPDLGEWHGVLEYNADLFEPSTIRQMVAAYLDILQSAIAEPGLSLIGLGARVPITPPARLAIAATFTADPILDVLRFWSKELDLKFTPVIAPYNQLLQELMAPESPLFSFGNALNVLLVRPEDWVRYVAPDRQALLLQRSTQEFIAAVRAAIPQMGCPLKIYLCPASAHIEGGTASMIARAEVSIREAFEGTNAIEVLDARMCAEKYSVLEIHDPQTDYSANVPYKSAFYVALGTAIVRQLRMRLSKSSKVLVLDCDNTLWQGLCAEEGAQGVVISEHHRALQEFALQQAAAGVLICLCSKNTPEHVLAVFRDNPGMIIKEADISASRINWEPKSSNLKSLAAELQLGMDSFVFIDDDARECEEISACFPQVLTLLLPPDPAELPRFLQHLWAFDRETISEEDRRRNAFYRDNRHRNLALQQSNSLAEFLASLDLRVDARSASPDQILRIAQLTQRTNQFNSSGLTFDRFELQGLIHQDTQVMAVDVSDRFGEYGLVGAVIYQKESESLQIQGFYLSCRVLGRGVEHRILSELGRIAQSANLGYIHIHYNQSSRNQPIRRFLDDLPGRLEIRANGPCHFVLPVADAVQAQPSLKENSTTRITPSTNIVNANIANTKTATARSVSGLARLPHHLSTAAQILARIDAAGYSQREMRTARSFVAPCSDLEKAIATEWSTILCTDKVGRNDNFFDLGGNSLLLVQLNANLINRLGFDINVTQMFQHPTVASLAASVSGQDSPDHSQEISTRSARFRAALQERRRQFSCRQS